MTKFTQNCSLRQLIAITLLTLFLFNLSGYFLYYKYAIYKSDQRILVQLDNREYSDLEMIELKIPLNLPYLTSQNHYERVDGEMHYNGTFYNYVERKVNNDTLYLKCRPNAPKTTLYRNLNEYTEKVNDLPTNKTTSGKKLSLSYEYVQSDKSLQATFKQLAETRYHTFIKELKPCALVADFFKPPRHIS